MSFLPFFLFLLFLLKRGRPADLNVGTTLFTKADRVKECWSSENVALLTTRMILEDLLPCTSILVIDSDEFVKDLVEYFRLVLEIVRKETRGKTKHITLLALTDLLGGYLRHAVLPIAKYAFYAGFIDYNSISILLGLFDELKLFLRSNGQGWAQPLPQNHPIAKEQCDNLIFVEKTEQSGHCDATLPLPFFDSNTKPSAIALPTKTCPLHNIEANTSSYLVMNFFVTSYKCLQLKNTKSENIDKFRCDFVRWIDDQVVPRLADEKFYAAFGGILRVRSTIIKLGVSGGGAEQHIDDFRQNTQTAQSQTLLAKFHMTKASMIIFAILVMLMIWVIFGTMCVYYRMKTVLKPCSPEGGRSTTTCTSLVSSKYSYQDKTKSSESSQGCFCIDDEDYTSSPPAEVKSRKKIEEEEDYTTTGSGPANDSSRTESRLPSITEMSEKTTSGKRTPSKKSSPKSRGTSKKTTPRSKKDGKKHNYLDSESEPETSSEEG
nr:PREDICTED: uncharacterized protein LOC100142239 isoform X2 [Tribolium castaneum]|eukprot:XP_015836427.1 PREDICTED: uncharacterized protein LOC100142239 isoform X2 [Tribolium castaneum]